MSILLSPGEIAQFGGVTTLAGLERCWFVARSIGCVNYASLTVMVYDTFLTLHTEVRLLWGTKLSLLKIAFMINRYIAPLFIGVNIYFISGLAKGLTDDVNVTITQFFCRRWFPVSAVAQILCLATVSFLFAFRLWAWYELSTRALYMLLSVWGVSLLATLGLIVELAVVHNQELVHEPFLNVCITVAPTIWPQWLPTTVEHGVYAFFLLFNAMATPRSKQQIALAILYRDGILFYMMTFSISLISLLIWGLMPRLYMGFGLYPPWVVYQVGISRLLLNVKTSQIFALHGRLGATREPQTYLPGSTILQDMSSSQKRGQGEARGEYVVATHDNPSIATGIEAGASASTSGIKKMGHGEDDGSHHEEEYGGGGETRNSVGREMRRIQPSSTRGIGKYFWWLRRKPELVNIHVDIVQDEAEGEWDGEGGLKDSRLGRRDEWL